MTWHSNCWMAFLNPETNKIEAVYIERIRAFEETVQKYGVPIPIDSRLPEKDWKTKEECEKQIDIYLFEQYYDIMFDEQVAAPIMKAIIEHKGEVCSGTKSFFTTFKREMGLHCFARSAWNEGMKLEVRLVPRED